MRKLLVLFVVAAVALSFGGAFGDPPEDGNGRGPFENPPCLVDDEPGTGPDHGHPNENSPRCTGELPNGDPFPGNGGNGNGNGNGNGDEPAGCPPGGDLSGVIIGIGQEINAGGGAPLGDVLIEVGCLVFDLTGL